MIRDFFIGRGYLEIETPCRIPSPAPEAHIDAFASGEWFLHTSPELCMKRVLAAGYPKIFQICRCFRMSERGSRHLPEFTLLEWYRSGVDYIGLMEECEDLILSVLRGLTGENSISYQGVCIDLEKPWERIRVEDVFSRFASMSLERALAMGAFDEIMAFEIEPRLSRRKPVFLYDYPVSLGALARVGERNPSFAERFELYISGIELVNAFSELTDAVEQRARFSKEQRERLSRGKTVYPDAEKFLECLCHMPESAGAALGVDRLVMILSDAAGVEDVVAFTPEEL